MKYKIFTIITLITLLVFAGCSKTPQDNLSSSKTIEMKYTPMQCQNEPWNEWLENSEIRFVKAPTQDEIIKMYFGEVHGINILEVRTVELGAVCEACDVCPKGEDIIVTINNTDRSLMEDLGWEIVFTK